MRPDRKEQRWAERTTDVRVVACASIRASRLFAGIGAGRSLARRWLRSRLPSRASALPRGSCRGRPVPAPDWRSPRRPGAPWAVPRRRPRRSAPPPPRPTTVTTAAITTSGNALQGVDVASFQHPGGAPISWSEVAQAGYRFAAIKATEGTYYKNPWYPTDSSGANAAGLYMTAYAFAIPNYSDGTSQAD